MFSTNISNYHNSSNNILCWMILLCFTNQADTNFTFCSASSGALFLCFFKDLAEQKSFMSSDGVVAFKSRRPPPETNGLIGHTTKTLVSLSDSQSAEAMTYPLDVMARTACIKREKHVILIMNVKGFTPCFRWKDRNWWETTWLWTKMLFFAFYLWLCLN